MTALKVYREGTRTNPAMQKRGAIAPRRTSEFLTVQPLPSDRDI